MYKVISTFSGIGGSSQGYKQAGLEVVGSVEFLDYQARIYKANHTKTKLYQADIRELDPISILKELDIKVGELDILDGSPPCSSFSTAGSIDDGWGKVKKYGNKTQRTDDLFLEYIRFIDKIQPKVFVAENVSGLIKGVSKGHFNEFFRLFKSCGYDVSAKLLNASNYYVPQKRQRIIFIGVRKDLNIKPSFPEPSIKKVNLSEAFKGVVNSLEELNEVDISKYAIYKELQKLPIYGKSNKYINLLKESPFEACRTLTATASQITAASVCHWDNRKFTIPELKRIASFPDDYIILGKNYNEKAEGLGRCVPPKMMEAIARNIKVNILDKTAQ
jgi:DNA (cytosine-5)-methyltransferase 1